MQFSISFSKILVLSLLIFSCSVIFFIYHPAATLENNDHDEIMNEQTVASFTKHPILANSLSSRMTMIETTKNIKPPVVISKTTLQPKTTSVWNNIIHDFSLDHKAKSPQVQAEIHRLLSEKGKFNKILADASPYIYYIHMQTKTQGLPAEIALLPFIESEFNPNDHSNKGALGLWQLMSATARILGVKVSGQYDGRRNLIASTKAAMLYFKDFGKNFKGDWLLALAAYNCGQGKVESAIRKSGSRNFWQLNVPKETKYYVPRLLAVAEIVSHPAQYHITLPKVLSAPYFSQFKITKPMQLKQFANNAGYSLETLTRLNPDYKLGLIPKEAAVLVPVKQA